MHEKASYNTRSRNGIYSFLSFGGSYRFVILASLLVILLIPSHAFAQSVSGYTRTPSGASVPTGTNIIFDSTISGFTDGAYVGYFIYPYGVVGCQLYNAADDPQDFSASAVLPDGVYNGGGDSVVAVDDYPTSDCGTFSQYNSINTGDTTFTVETIVPTLSDLILTASTTLTAATGFDMGSLAAFMSSLFTMVMGSGLYLLQSLLMWVIALVVIGACIYFIRRAFRFFRH